MTPTIPSVKSSIRQSEDKRTSPQQQLSNQLFVEKQLKYKGVPAEFIPPVKVSDRNKSGLVQCAYHKLRLDGHPVNLHPKSRRDILYDIETVLNRRTFYILAVPGPLVQNTAQYRFQQKAEGKGAGYICIKSYSEFLMVYSTIMEAVTGQLSLYE